MGGTTTTTVFNPDKKEILTIRECLAPAMAITEQEDADQYLADYVAYIQKHLDKEPRRDGLTAEEIANINIGYYAGYYDHETRACVERLFRCAHPIFGSVAKNGSPTNEQALAAGAALASHNQT